MRSDSSALRVVAHTTIASQGGYITSGFGAVWAADPGAGEVVRLATDTGRVNGRIRTGGRPRTLDTGAGAVWVFELDSGRLRRIDPGAGRVMASIPLSLPAVTQAEVWGATDTVWVITLGPSCCESIPGATRSSGGCDQYGRLRAAQRRA